MGELIHPYEEERELKRALRVAKDGRDRERQDKIKENLIKLYVKYGEYFKMSDYANPHEAIHLLEKAITMKPSHSIANYRLGHLYYRNEKYEKAIPYFHKGLNSDEPQPLTPTQAFLSNLFIANSAIHMTKQAVKKMETMQDDMKINMDEDMIDSYRMEMDISSQETLDRLYFRKLTKDGESVISNERYINLLDFEVNGLLLVKDGDRCSIKYGMNIAIINHTSFCIIYTILRSKDMITNTEIHEKLIGREMENTIIEEDNIRQIFSRLRDVILFWDEVFDSGRVGRRTGRKLKPGIEYMILCNASDLFPDEF
jgi:hypothetical protein